MAKSKSSKLYRGVPKMKKKRSSANVLGRTYALTKTPKLARNYRSLFTTLKQRDYIGQTISAYTPQWGLSAANTMDIVNLINGQPNISALKTLYDQIRLVRIRGRFNPSATQAIKDTWSGTLYAEPAIMVAYDLDGFASPPTREEVLRNTTAKVFDLKTDWMYETELATSGFQQGTKVYMNLQNLPTNTWAYGGLSCHWADGSNSTTASVGAPGVGTWIWEIDVELRGPLM